ncbi:msl0939 [Mesorhizobium japonicum MAFF 303099]|uniref:Msl0939 protein n=1 Tax=Mesorhizobium japonicum (strain LMG 29417 / CECT 9101 / MAFF 303099) TaxID=266835 RepID=Q98LP3_RHILO|nr:msl0939 [Mesorhizobium japonicum MAFF 303099]
MLQDGARGLGRGDHPEAEEALKGSAQTATCPVMERRVSESLTHSDMPDSAWVASVIHAKLFALPF